MHIESTFRLARTPNRYKTGLPEVALKNVFGLNKRLQGQAEKYYKPVPDI